MRVKCNRTCACLVNPPPLRVTWLHALRYSTQPNTWLHTLHCASLCRWVVATGHCPRVRAAQEHKLHQMSAMALTTWHWPVTGHLGRRATRAITGPQSTQSSWSCVIIITTDQAGEPCVVLHYNIAVITIVKQTNKSYINKYDHSRESLQHPIKCHIRVLSAFLCVCVCVSVSIPLVKQAEHSSLVGDDWVHNNRHKSIDRQQKYSVWQNNATDICELISKNKESIAKLEKKKIKPTREGRLSHADKGTLPS